MCVYGCVLVVVVCVCCFLCMFVFTKVPCQTVQAFRFLPAKENVSGGGLLHVVLFV